MILSFKIYNISEESDKINRTQDVSLLKPIFGPNSGHTGPVLGLRIILSPIHYPLIITSFFHNLQNCKNAMILLEEMIKKN